MQGRAKLSIPQLALCGGFAGGINRSVHFLSVVLLELVLALVSVKNIPTTAILIVVEACPGFMIIVL